MPKLRGKGCKTRNTYPTRNLQSRVRASRSCKFSSSCLVAPFLAFGFAIHLWQHQCPASAPSPTHTKRPLPFYFTHHSSSPTAPHPPTCPGLEAPTPHTRGGLSHAGPMQVLRPLPSCVEPLMHALRHVCLCRHQVAPRGRHFGQDLAVGPPTAELKWRRQRRRLDREAHRRQRHKDDTRGAFRGTPLLETQLRETPLLACGHGYDNGLLTGHGPACARFCHGYEPGAGAVSLSQPTHMSRCPHALIIRRVCVPVDRPWKSLVGLSRRLYYPLELLHHGRNRRMWRRVETWRTSHCDGSCLCRA